MNAGFLDLSKAFDRVWYDGLLYKLKVNGISGNILQLLQKVLKGRKTMLSFEWKIVKVGIELCKSPSRIGPASAVFSYLHN